MLRNYGIHWWIFLLVLVCGEPDDSRKEEKEQISGWNTDAAVDSPPKLNDLRAQHRYDQNERREERVTKEAYRHDIYHRNADHEHHLMQEEANQGQELSNGIQGQGEQGSINSKSEKDNGLKEDNPQNAVSANEIGNIDDGNGNQSYFSFGNIISKIVDPVLEEFKNTSTEPTNKNLSSELMAVANGSDVISNETLTDEVQDKNKTDKKIKFRCTGKNITLDNSTAVVQIINNTKLLSMLNFDKNMSMSDCIVVMFFVPWCGFCAKTAPHYNAVARAFPQLDVVAVDAAQFSNLNAKFGTVSVPNILLFHQSRTVVRFNQTKKSFDNLISFIKNATGLEPNTTVNVTEEDYIGPLSSVPTETTDYLLLVAWVFVLVCSSIMFIQSNHGQQWINKVKILWQEHQHIE